MPRNTKMLVSVQIRFPEWSSHMYIKNVILFIGCHLVLVVLAIEF